MRGEYFFLRRMFWKVKGSPPLARGILLKIRLILAVLGITPACAGNTGSVSRPMRHKGDHPRLRGEYAMGLPRYVKNVGSPPLARGIQTADLGKAGGNRITPACAGNTLKKSHIYSLFPISTSKFHLVSQTPEMS